jgi:hypothetical protein
MAGVRELDTGMPGTSLLKSRLITFQAAVRYLQSAVINPGGRDITASSCRQVTTSGGLHRSVVAQIVDLSASDGRLLRVLRTQTAPFPNQSGESYALTTECAVLSVDATGQNVLVNDFNFGRIDDGVFTALPGSPDVVAAW